MSTDNDNHHPPPSLQETWNEFKTALYAPVNQDFEPFYWVGRLSRALLNLLIQQKLRRVVPLVRPIMWVNSCNIKIVVSLIYFWFQCWHASWFRSIARLLAWQWQRCASGLIFQPFGKQSSFTNGVVAILLMAHRHLLVIHAIGTQCTPSSSYLLHQIFLVIICGAHS